MTWLDIEDIAEALFEAHPGQDPLTLRFTVLRDWIIALPGFHADPAECNEKKLEAVQMAWLEVCRST